MSLERGMALVALENAGGKAGGILVQLGRRSAEFQRRKPAFVAHDGKINKKNKPKKKRKKSKRDEREEGRKKVMVEEEEQGERERER